MKRNMIILVSVLLAVTLAVGGSIAMAAQPPDKGKPPHAGEGNQLIPRPNGFPAGPHFNLNIHGKKAGYNCTETSGGGSIFVDEYGPATIQYVTNKKSSVENLTVLDPCAVDNGTAKVQLPYEADGYFVFGRILGKPNHGQSDNASSVILYPNVVVQACNDTGYNTSDFANLTSCDDSLLALGFILYNQVYLAENETYVRFDPTVTKGKGKSKATDITALFTYVGWVVHPDVDISGPNGTPDGVIDDYDVPANASNTTTYPGIELCNIEDTANVTVEEWLCYQSGLTPPMAWYFSELDGMWIFNIADLVVTEQGLVNDGTKLLQIRFYPKDGTTFD
jgi:hypothetical protein